MKKEEEEPLSPMARIFQSPAVDYCGINIMGFKTKLDPDDLLDALKHNVSKHPRFSSKLSDNGAKWVETKVNVEDHVVVPYIDLYDIGEDPDKFVDDYISRLTTIPLDRSRPLWDIHILNVKTSDAEAVSVIRTHHSLGDGTSLTSLILACTHKTSDPNMSSTSTPPLKRRNTVSHGMKNKGWFIRWIINIGSKMRMIWNTIIDVLLLFATMTFFKDTETPIKGGDADVSKNHPKRFYHRIVSLDDIKLIKNAMNMTVNDVLLGMTQASLSHYLNQQYAKKDKENGASRSNNLPDGIRFRAGCTVNLRSEIGFKPLADMMVKDSKCRWGNYFSFIFLPFSISLQTDPLVYLKNSRSIMARKKHSYQADIAYLIAKFVTKTLGDKAATTLFNRSVMNITTCVSNVIGPVEEISFRGHPIAYMAPSSYGHSHPLLVHYMSYAEKMVISLAVDPMVISDPHKICDEMEASLKAMKVALSKRGLL